MLANSLTKLDSDGTLPWLDLKQVLTSGYWQPARVWRLNGVQMRPGASRFQIPHNQDHAVTGQDSSASLTFQLSQFHAPMIFDMSLHDDSDEEHEYPQVIVSSPSIVFEQIINCEASSNVFQLDCTTQWLNHSEEDPLLGTSTFLSFNHPPVAF
jgi:hypothetical protein